jgi:hypothetical protein
VFKKYLFFQIIKVHDLYDLKYAFNTMKQQYISNRMTKMKKIGNNKAGKEVGQKALSYTAGRNAL